MEDRADRVATAAEALLRHQGMWRHRRVETLTVLSHEQVRRAVSVDFTVPGEYREDLQFSDAGEGVVPLALLAKQPLVHFDLRNEEGHSVPLLTSRQNALIDRELLYLLLDGDLEDQGADDETRQAVVSAAVPIIEAVVEDDLAPEGIEAIEREHGIEPLAEFRAMAETLADRFVLWAVIRGLDRRRVLKFAYDEPFRQQPEGLVHFYDAPGCTEAGSYHVEVVVPNDLRARTTTLVDAAGGIVLATGVRDSDRPALYLGAELAHAPAEPGVLVAYGAERGRFLTPAAIVAAVIMLLLAVPLLFSDLERLAGSAGPAIGIVLSTSAVFSALVLRTDEHPLLRLMLVRYRLCLVASTLAALLAAAFLGFRAASWLLTVSWAIAALVAASSAAILVVAALRAPPARSSPAPTP